MPELKKFRIYFEKRAFMDVKAKDLYTAEEIGMREKGKWSDGDDWIMTDDTEELGTEP